MSPSALRKSVFVCRICAVLIGVTLGLTACQTVKTPSYAEMMANAALTTQVEAGCQGHDYDALSDTKKRSLCADADHADANLKSLAAPAAILKQMRLLEGRAK